MRMLFCVAALALTTCAPLAFGQGKAAHKPNRALLHPELLKEKAPATFKIKFQTTKGSFVVECKRAWSPAGVDRFYNLSKNGFFDNIKFFRVVQGFVVQFGMHGDPAVGAKWRDANIPDEKVVKGNKRGFLTYAKSGPNTRSTQYFINLADNDRLDEMGFPAFGHVTEGMDVVDKLYNGYGEAPNQGQIAEKGNAYLDSEFPKLDFVQKVIIIK